MELSAVILARALYFLEVLDLNPRGAANFFATCGELTKRFGFAKFPQKLEDFDASKGITFEHGYLDGATVERFVVYQNGLQVDTRADTDVSDKILLGILDIASSELGYTYRPEMITHKAYVSQFTFHSDAALLSFSPFVNRVSEDVSKIVSVNMKSSATFRPSAIQISVDPHNQKYPIAPFSIERRAQTPFSENKYFSSAPLPTKIHISLVTEYEETVSSSKK
jgi:hypothetical protein